MPGGFEGQWLGAGSTLWGRELRSWLCCSASDFTSLCSQWAASGHPSPRVGLQVFMRMDVIPFQGARQGRCAQQIQATKITEDRLWAKPFQGLRLLTICWWWQKEHKPEHPWWQVSGRWAGMMKKGAEWTVMAGPPHCGRSELRVQRSRTAQEGGRQRLYRGGGSWVGLKS